MNVFDAAVARECDCVRESLLCYEISIVGFGRLQEKIHHHAIGLGKTLVETKCNY